MRKKVLSGLMALVLLFCVMQVYASDNAVVNEMQAGYDEYKNDEQWFGTWRWR